MEPPAAAPRAPHLRRMGRRENPQDGAAGTLARARRHGGHGGLPGIRAGQEYHRADDERRWRVCDALVTKETAMFASRWLCALLLVLGFSLNSVHAGAQKLKQPNILYIMSDDHASAAI